MTTLRVCYRPAVFFLLLRPYPRKEKFGALQEERHYLDFLRFKKFRV
jgi:hypothetical protein